MIRHKSLTALIAILTLTALTATKANAQEDFETFRRRQQQQFNDFKEEQNREFANFLRVRWEEFELFRGTPKPLEPAPEEIPEADPNEDIRDVEVPAAPNEDIAPEDTTPSEPDAPRIPDPTPDVPEVPATPDIPVVTPPRPGYDKAAVTFLGFDREFEYDTKLRIKLAGTTENKVADGWEKLAAADYQSLLDALAEARRTLALNDWAYYRLVSGVADRIYSTADVNEKTLFTAFMLNNSGYMARMATDQSQKKLLLLLAVAEEVYETPYYELSGHKFYLTGPKYSGAIYTYGKEKGDGRQPIRMLCEKRMVAKQSVRPVKVHSPSMGGALTINYNPHLTEFYKQMPMCNMVVHFNTRYSAETATSINDQIGARLKGLTANQKVEKLMKFMHEGFPYKTDDDQFGGERYLFAEETFAYPYSDCEDNSILFARLIRELTGLEVVGLLYSDHVATAVKLEGNVPGNYITHNGARYVICDPTYINSRMGQCMPQYRGQTAKIIPVM